MQLVRTRYLAALLSCLAITVSARPADAAELKLLFLGDNGHHDRPIDFGKLNQS